MEPNITREAWMSTLTGKEFDLIGIDSNMVCVEQDVPVALSRIPRYAGHTLAAPFSVAQHCCVGSDQIMLDGGTVADGYAFLLHDAHEAYITDITTPTARAIRYRMGVSGEAFRIALEDLKHDLDAAIREQLDLRDWSPETYRAVKAMDLIMLESERRALLTPTLRAWSHDGRGVRCLPADLFVPWTAERAAMEWTFRLTSFQQHFH
jgi:uncharacterized protein